MSKIELRRIYTIFDVNSPKKCLDAIYSGKFTKEQEDMLVSELVDLDMTVNDLSNVLVNEMMVERGMMN